MEGQFITLDKENIGREHICCAFTSKEAQEGYELKKQWLIQEFDQAYVFRRLDARAKVFIEYIAAEKAWIPVDAPNYLMLGCFWVSGQYKGHGYGKALLQSAIEDAKRQNKAGLVAVVGTKKFHFMADGKWLLRQGFEVVESLPNGFHLLVLKIDADAANPQFKECVKRGVCEDKEALVVYYSNRCPFTEYQVNTVLTETAKERNLPLKIVKLETLEQAQTAPTPGTIFSLFYNGRFITTDVSVCMGSRFDKTVKL